MSDPYDGIEEAFATLPKPVLFALLGIAAVIGAVAVPLRWTRRHMRRRSIV